MTILKSMTLHKQTTKTTNLALPHVVLHHLILLLKIRAGPTSSGVACLRVLGALAPKELPDISRILQSSSGKTSFKGKGHILPYPASVLLLKPALLVRHNLVVLKFRSTRLLAPHVLNLTRFRLETGRYVTTVVTVLRRRLISHGNKCCC